MSASDAGERKGRAWCLPTLFICKLTPLKHLIENSLMEKAQSTHDLASG
jgi:hypothetical protein